MLPNKRLQVFISSTYKDLIEERQAAVQAILSAGHIPAGMELFAAGDQSQMSVIKAWIDQSDVYLLILGGSYGSIEPISSKSYTHLEYEYALSIGKPLFSVVITDEALEGKIKNEGSKVLETQNQSQYREFKKVVLTKMVRFWSDSKDIKLAIFETISEFVRRDDLIGWVPGNFQVDTSKMALELARLGKANAILEDENQKLKRNINHSQVRSLPPKRRGYTVKGRVGGQPVILKTGEYQDGTIGEIYINMEKEGATMRSILDCFAMAVSVGLQYGVPLEEFVDKYIFTRFEPSGIVDHPNIKTSTSVFDFIFRMLAYEYLDRDDLVHVKDPPMNSIGEDEKDD